MSSPVVRRWKAGDCTRCGRPVGNYTLWCRRCVDYARANGRGQTITQEEFEKYLEALKEWAESG